MIGGTGPTPLTGGPHRADSGRDGYARALDSMLMERTTSEERADILSALRAYRLEQVERLAAAGYRIGYCLMPDHQGGVQNGFQKTIQLNPHWKGVEVSDPQNRRRAILHEVAHAIDFLDRQDSLSLPGRVLSRFGKVFASQDDPELAQLYRGYIARTAVEAAARLNAEIPDGDSRKFTVLDRTFAARRGISPEGRAQVEQTGPGPYARWLSGARKPALWTALGTAISLATGLLPVAAGVALVGSGVTLHKLATTLFAARESARFESLDEKVSQADGSLLHVSGQGGRLMVELPERVDPATFSLYAAESRKVYEYYAEGVAFYLNSPEEREELRRKDPALYDWIRSRKLAAEDAGP
ncbi:MAG: hypothetical protein AB1758_25065 [Candidatus Eremiobacterota bacterium]